MEWLWLATHACWIPRIDSAETKQASTTDHELRERLLDKLVEERLLGSTRQTTELDPTSLPLRQLPPGNTASLYLMYLAFIRSSGGSPASRATFYQASKSWYCCLRFRPKSEHSMCVICQSLKMAIHAATDTKIGFSKLPTFQVSVCSWRNMFFEYVVFFKRVSLCGLAEDFKEHARLCDQLLGHYSSQYDDRRVYWAARNRSTYQKDLLCIIIDSFDRSKLCLPSYPFGRCPKRTVYEFFSRHLADHLCIENSYDKFPKASLMFTWVSRHMIFSVPERCPKINFWKPINWFFDTI